MKVAVVFGGSVSPDFKSWYAKGKEKYLFDGDTPHIVYNPIFNYCFFWEGGCFLNLVEWEDELPDLDLDIIIYANERHGLDESHWDKYSVARLKNKYPKVKVVGFLKEMTVPPHRYKNWIRFLNDCDFVVGACTGIIQELSEYKKLQLLLNKKINFFSSPHDIEYVYDNFYSEVKDNTIFAYLPNPMHRRSKTIEFAEYIGKKYDIPVVRKPFTNGSNDAIHMAWNDFTNLWSPCLWHFNLDPVELQQGQHVVSVANVGSINIGGMNESHHILFPETATCDEKILEEKFELYFNDEDKRFEVINYAWEKLNELYSIDVVKKQLLNMLSK
jgi:hypothetical protein